MAGWNGERRVWRPSASVRGFVGVIIAAWILIIATAGWMGALVLIIGSVLCWGLVALLAYDDHRRGQ